MSSKETVEPSASKICVPPEKHPPAESPSTIYSSRSSAVQPTEATSLVGKALRFFCSLNTFNTALLALKSAFKSLMREALSHSCLASSLFFLKKSSTTG